jgi:hypothetical protein
MKETKIVPGAAMLVALALLLAAAYRGLSINNLIVATSTGDISRHLSASILIDWSLSCTLLILVAIWLFFLASDLRKKLRRAWFQGVIIGISLVIFGAGFWYRYPSSLHLPVFLLLGLVLLVPLLIHTKRFDQK